MVDTNANAHMNRSIDTDTKTSTGFESTLSIRKGFLFNAIQ